MKQQGILTSIVIGLAACGGGKGGGAKAPSAAAFSCVGGVHSAGWSAKAATWDAVAAQVSSTPDAMCEETSPCGEGEAVSFVGAPPDDVMAVKVKDGWVMIEWNGYDGNPTATVKDLGGLLWVHRYLEQLGREEVELDDGEQTTATVITGQIYDDYVIDPAAGKVLFHTHCGGEGEAERETVIARDGDTFRYTGCQGPAEPIAFTAAQAAECPDYVDGAR